MIGMVMGDEHAADGFDARGQELLAKIRPAIDQQALPAAFEQDRGAQPAVLRLGGIALTPAAPKPRHAGRRPATQDAYPHADALLNSLKKLSVVCSARVSISTPRRAATNLAVSA